MIQGKINYRAECLKIIPNLKCFSGSRLNYQFRVGIGFGRGSASFYSNVKDTRLQAWKDCYEKILKDKK